MLLRSHCFWCVERIQIRVWSFFCFLLSCDSNVDMHLGTLDSCYYTFMNLDFWMKIGLFIYWSSFNLMESEYKRLIFIQLPWSLDHVFTLEYSFRECSFRHSWCLHEIVLTRDISLRVSGEFEYLSSYRGWQLVWSWKICLSNFLFSWFSQ